MGVLAYLKACIYVWLKANGRAPIDDFVMVKAVHENSMQAV